MRLIPEGVYPGLNQLLAKGWKDRVGCSLIKNSWRLIADVCRIGPWSRPEWEVSYLYDRRQLLVRSGRYE